ncbi:MAG: B12-binding domain-containing radical SAM protein [Promethearchaeota archaeon]
MILKFIKKRATFPPLGLLTVASMLPKEWDLKLIDLNVQNLQNKDVVWADMVFISAMLIQKDNAQKIIDRCKKIDKHKKIVAGGPAFTSLTDKFHNVDHFVLGEAEITLQPFLDDLKNGDLKRIYTSKERPDITNTPVPLWSLIDFNVYSTMLVQFSRGCPFNCEFCDIIIMNGRIPRTKTTEQMIVEFQSLYDSGYRGSLFIVDDNFIGNKTKVKHLLNAIIKWQKAFGYPFSFLTEASMNLAKDRELMRLMSEANFDKVFLGIESPNIESLKECKKYQNVKIDLVKTVKLIQKFGLQVMGGFIIGFDHDTKDIFDAQINYIAKTGIVTAMVGLLTAMPKTNLWKRLKKEGRLIDDETDGNNMGGDVNFVPKMGHNLLIKGYQMVLKTIYSPKQYYKRIETFLENYTFRGREKLTWVYIRAFFKSFGALGIFSKSKFLYWKLLLKTLLKRIKMLPLAVELAMYGLHFENVTAEICRNNN